MLNLGYIINNNLQDSNPENFVKIIQKLNTDGGKFYFTFSSTNLHGKNLWITDRTQEGTIQLLNTKDSLINNYSYTLANRWHTRRHKNAG